MMDEVEPTTDGEVTAPPDDVTPHPAPTDGIPPEAVEATAPPADAVEPVIPEAAPPAVAPIAAPLATEEPAPIAALVAEVPEALPQPTIRLEEKHPLAIRWMHWINFPVLFTMIWSGLLIYWNDSDNAYQHPHEVYRVGVGSLTLFHLFPAWFYTNKFWDMRYHVTEGLGYHFFFMWIFAINGLIYVTYLIASGNWRLMVPTMRSWKQAMEVTLYDLGLRKIPPPEQKYNGAQKIAYTAIILMGAGSLITGVSIYKPTQAHWLTSLLGGYEMARWEHFWLTMGFCGFFLLHVGQVVKTGWNNFRAMVSGVEIRRADAIPYVQERRDA
jgi:thiosulfate reductase cytochrome b subunit